MTVLSFPCQPRGGNVQEFFKHKTLRFPPSFSQTGCIRVVNKSELLTKCLELLSVVPEETPSVDAVVVYGAALVYTFRPGTNKTFDEYAPIVFPSPLHLEAAGARKPY